MSRCRVLFSGLLFCSRVGMALRHVHFGVRSAPWCHDVRSFIGACNFYRRHIKNFTYTSAILTGPIKKSTTWRWGPQEQQAFVEFKDKVANAKCLGVPRAQGEIILVTPAMWAEVERGSSGKH